ncbi:hypothetical protein FOZ63_007248 [Perkinsus olseni]|uniref:Uncharacterized protein n=1 Tax=Perkinsus olseni TaxID=32597 RepID=A0A7J6UDW7_PEROL|nr:hypothetical protein FOZ63_007248 [Perkinsus olseni]
MSCSTEEYVRHSVRQRVAAVLLLLNRSVCRGRSPLLDCLTLLWEYALPAVVAYERAPGIDLGSTTARVLLGRLSSGRCLMLSEKSSSHDYLMTDVDLRNGTQITKTIADPLDGARVREFCPDPNSGRLVFVGYHASGAAVHPERVGYTTQGFVSIQDVGSSAPIDSSMLVGASHDVIETTSAPLLDCRFDHSLCCCPSNGDNTAAIYCISSPPYHTPKRFVSRIHLQPPAMFGRSEDLLEVKQSVREMRVSSVSGELTVLLLARGDDRDGSPVIFSWKTGGPLLQMAVMDSFHVRFDIGCLGYRCPSKTMLLLDGHFPGRKLRALDIIEGDWVYEVEAPQGSEFSAWFFVDNSATQATRSRISLGLLWGTARLRNSCQLLCWAPQYQ